MLAAPSGLDALAADRGLIPSPQVEQARAVRAQAEEAETALGQIAGVRAARVILGDSGVAVVVRHDPGAAPVTADGVRAIVAVALPLADPETVEVVLSAAAPEPVVPSAGRANRGLLAALGLVCVGLGGWVATRSVARRARYD